MVPFFLHAKRALPVCRRHAQEEGDHSICASIAGILLLTSIAGVLRLIKRHDIYAAILGGLQPKKTDRYRKFQIWDWFFSVFFFGFFGFFRFFHFGQF